MLTLLLGRDWTTNRDTILNQIAQDVRGQKPGRILLVPELISHDYERRLAAVAGDTASRFAQVLSFTRLARRVSESVGSAARQCLDNGGRVVAMAAAAGSLSSRLKAYAKVETRPEFLTELVDAVDEFKRCCICAADLQEAARQSQGSLAQKLEELSLIMDAYDGLCAHGKRDPRDQITWALEQLEETDFAKEHVFYVDGFPDLTRQNLAIVEHLMVHSPHVVVSLNCEDPHSGELAFEKAAQTARELLLCAQRQNVQVHIQKVEPAVSPLAPVQRGLFQGTLAAEEDLSPRLHLLRTESVYDECQAAAETILQQVHSGCRYRDIALVLPDMAGYSKILQLVMRKCRIPLYLSGTEDILRSGVIASVLLALEAAIGGFDRKDMLRYLRSAMSPISQELCDEVENHAMIWSISGKGWTEPWQQHPEGLSGQWDDRSLERLQRLEESRKQIMEPLMQLRQDLQTSQRMHDQVEAIYAYLNQIGFAQRLDAYASQMEQDGDLRKAQILNQLWQILLSALQQLQDVLGNSVWDTEHFTRLLRLLLSQYDVGTIPPVLDAVMAGPVSAMRCQEEKHLIILGAKEGALPGYGGTSGVLTDQERTALRDLGVPLTGGAVDGLQAEFAEIYGVFCGAKESITLTCSDPQPSFIYRRLTQLSPERPVKPALGDALTRPTAAAALLATYDDMSAAEQLQILDAYLRMDQRRRFALGNVSADTVEALYGQRLHLSASQVDLQAQCKLAYFLKYGLSVKERKEATVDPAEFGTYVHAVLEETAREVMALGGFHTVSLEDTLQLARKHSESYARERFSQLSSQRMEYLFQRNVEELEWVVRELWEELHQSEFAPVAFELQFDKHGPMAAIDISGSRMAAVLRGFVDRVDTWQRGDSTYFRVVDYKTGKKDFDYCDVLSGVGLQMLLYLFALEEAGETVLGDRRVSAGIQYFPARVPFVAAEGSMTEEEANAMRRKQWGRPGLLLSDSDAIAGMDPSEDMARVCCGKNKDGQLTGDIADRSQWNLLKQYVFRLLGNMVDQIAQGDITPDPYTRGSSHNACTFCPYGDICHKDSVPGRRNFKAVKPQQFWEDVKREVEKHGKPD